ncbi:DMT family transporter [Pelagibacterium limicola]|uniref:DMT family transporter n=1 Tax=Pelagibacterium limicola TaxID=2791022 RepID=UPI001FE7CB53|nr:DMT family transporter [Pelagibacterium limicola]
MAWLLADMLLVTAMTALVKLAGADYPAIQLVFIRSLIGLGAITPLIWRYRAEVFSTRRAGRHSFRVFCNALALTCNFSALAALPLALVNAIGFMRPLVVTILAVILLAERVGAMQWVGVALGFAGVLIIIAPGEIPFDWGLAAAFGSVFFGSMATIQTRALKDENTTVMMVFYTVGLSILTAVPAILFWNPVAVGDWPLLIGIGLLAQIAQFCFLKAYQSTPASILAPLGYLSIVFASLTGYFVFSEVPGTAIIPGIVVIFIGLQLSTRARGVHHNHPKYD